MILNIGGGRPAHMPTFTYTGNYRVAENQDANWSIEFLSSGTLTFSNNSQLVDIFCVGGGGGGSSGGGGGGYTNTVRSSRLTNNVAYSITVGSGGTKNGGSGGTSSFGELCTANGGGAGINIAVAGNNGRTGGNGGSGGGGANENSSSYSGTRGTDGRNGSSGNFLYDYDPDVGNIWYTTSGGTGQITTTRAFGESSGKLYASGGHGYTPSSTPSGDTANSGNGGYGGDGRINGYSGIVIVRSARS